MRKKENKRIEEAKSSREYLMALLDSTIAIGKMHKRKWQKTKEIGYWYGVKSHKIREILKKEELLDSKTNQPTLKAYEGLYAIDRSYNKTYYFWKKNFKTGRRKKISKVFKIEIFYWDKYKIMELVNKELKKVGIDDFYLYYLIDNFSRTMARNRNIKTYCVRDAILSEVPKYILKRIITKLEFCLGWTDYPYEHMSETRQDRMKENIIEDYYKMI